MLRAHMQIEMQWNTTVILHIFLNLLLTICGIGEFIWPAILLLFSLNFPTFL